MENLEKVTANMPVKVGGKVVSAGEPFECEPQEAKRLRKAGVLNAGSVDVTSADQSEQDEDFDLETSLTNLIAEDHDIASMNMEQINALLPIKVKRADVDAALEAIKVDEQS